MKLEEKYRFALCEYICINKPNEEYLKTLRMLTEKCPIQVQCDSPDGRFAFEVKKDSNFVKEIEKHFTKQKGTPCEILKCTLHNYYE